MNDMSKWYQILDLEPGASPEEVKQAYRDMVKVWHPDRFGSDERLRAKAEGMQKEINLAFEQLEDYVPSPESEIDEEEAAVEGAAARAASASPPNPARPSPFDNPSPPIAKHKPAFQDTWDIRAPLGFRAQDGGLDDSGDPAGVVPGHPLRRPAFVLVLAVVVTLAIVLGVAVILR